jgi:NAD(P)-dependent dehydrogenase (short-subunit alcohol dehydrogenase family)
MDFDGKTAFITGGAAGIGFAIATTLARNGAAIAIADIDAAGASVACKRLAEQGFTAMALTCDVADPASTLAAAATTAKRLGGIDLLINNAGLHLPHYTKPVLALGSEKWRQLLAVNVLGIVHCAEACRTYMRARGGGVIVNISSMAGFKALNAYGISKLAVRGLTVALAHELAGDGIRVCCVAPGFVDSDHGMREFPEARREHYVQEVQLVKRLGRMDDVASAVRFLCGDEASFITAETLLVTGGALPRI